MPTATAPTSQLRATQIPFEAPEHVREALASMGRTEDVRLSPSGNRLAFACYTLDQVAVADVAISRTAAGVEVAVTDLARYSSTSLREPHGVDFVDDQTIVVGNRSGEIAVLRLPLSGADGQATRVGSVVSELGAVGSVAVRPLSTGGHELLTVHNWANALARYLLDEDGTISGGEVVVGRWLDLPDGLTRSSDGRWLAVSNHNTHDVLVFESEALNGDADPVGVLRGAGYPHGLRFGLDDRHLLVADAGAPYVDVFERAGDTWSTVSYPATTIRVMDDDTFTRGHHNAREGGPKGLDVDPRTNVLVITAESAPVAFFDVDLALEVREVRPRVGYELERLRDLEHSKKASAEAVNQLNAVLGTKAWRLTSPARAAYGRLRRSRR